MSSCFLFVSAVSYTMNWHDWYYTAAVIGVIVTFLAQVILIVTVDAILASALTPFYAVWIIVFVISWRNKHPRR